MLLSELIFRTDFVYLNLKVFYKNLLFRVRSMKNEACGNAYLPQQDMGFAELAPFKHYRD